MGLTEDVGKKLAGLVVAGAAAVAAALWLPLAPFASSTSDTSRASASAPANGGQNAAKAERLASLPQRASLDRPGALLFSPGAPRPSPPAAPPQAAAQPAVPPMPYRVAGNLVDNGGYQLVLAKGDRVFVVREGDMLEGGYAVESVRANAVTLLNIALGVRQDLAVEFAADAPAATSAAVPVAQPGEQSKPTALAAARLRWEGPVSVREGEEFDVTLRVSSEQPVRALPLHLSYDAKLLEPVGVRPGSFFAGGDFSYHISPNGSILIRASGEATVPSDAEIVVYSFKPIRASATAELVISSVMIQGAERTAIVSDRPTFRINIIQ